MSRPKLLRNTSRSIRRERWLKPRPKSKNSPGSSVILHKARAFLHRIGMRCRKVGFVPGKGSDPDKIEEQENFRQQKLEPLREEALAGQKAVFFVDAAHFVHRAYLGFIGVFYPHLSDRSILLIPIILFIYFSSATSLSLQSAILGEINSLGGKGEVCPRCGDDVLNSQ